MMYLLQRAREILEPQTRDALGVGRALRTDKIKAHLVVGFMNLLMFEING